MPRLLTHGVADFSGGLNLEPDGFKLAANESPDLLNVDVLARGGFQQRKGMSLSYRLLFQVFQGAAVYTPADGPAQLLVQAGTSGQRIIALPPPADYVHSGSEIPPGGIEVGNGYFGRMRAAMFKNKLYVVTGEQDTFRWDGGTRTDLVHGWNNDLENPTPSDEDGKAPKAKLICTWQGVLVVGAVYEGTEFHGSRIRWSHPNYPEDWHQLHYIDVDPGSEHDEITALVPLHDRLLVFKRDSIHAIHGSPPEGLVVEQVTHELGTLRQESVVATEMGVFFYDPLEGVFLYDGRNIKWMFEALYPAIRDGRIAVTEPDHVALGWGNRRLWVSLRTREAENNGPNAVFVLDPSMGGRNRPGPWVRYEFDSHGNPGWARAPWQYAEWAPPGGGYEFLGFFSHDGEGYFATKWAAVARLDRGEIAHDQGLVMPQRTMPIHSYFQTAWIDLGNPAQEKRWKRPEVVVKAGMEGTVRVEAFIDYTYGRPRRRWEIDTREKGSDHLVWGVGQWGQAKWAPEGTNLNEIERGVPLGNARAISLRFTGTDLTAFPYNLAGWDSWVESLPRFDWGVNHVAFKFIPKKIRS